MPIITEALARKAEKGTVLRDDVIKGFHLKVTPAGNRVWLYAFRLRNGERRNPKLGDYPAMAVEVARDKARAMYLAKERGEDPTRQKEPDLDAASTMAKIKDRFLAGYGEQHFGRSASQQFKYCWNNYIEPHLGALSIAAVTWRDVEKMVLAAGKRSHSMANNARIYAGLMLTWAEKQGLRPDNTSSLKNCTHYRVAPRRRDIGRAEFKRLLAAMDQADTENWESAAAIYLFRLIMLCGCRPSELQLRKRSAVEFFTQGDVEHARVWCEHTKSGRKRLGTTGARWLYVGAEGAKIIRQLFARWPTSEWLIPCERGRHGYLRYYWGPWWRLLAMAGLDNLQPKDLRHYYVTYQLQSGVPLNVVSDMVGHANPQVTASVYAHVLTEMRREQAAKAEAGIAAHFKEASSA